MGMSALAEMALPTIIGAMTKGRKKLTSKEKTAQDRYLETLNFVKRATETQVIVAMIGLVGSGKSAVAKELARHIGATIIQGDAIRIELRKQHERYEKAHAIGEHAVLEVLKRGGNVVLDSDFIDAAKRMNIREKARKARVRLEFVRSICDLDVMVGRALSARYRDSADDFFGGAASPWKGSAQTRGAAVKVREMWRRTPQHYRWINDTGGQWILKKLPFATTDIDTTDEKAWPRAVARFARKLS